MSESDPKRGKTESEFDASTIGGGSSGLEALEIESVCDESNFSMAEPKLKYSRILNSVPLILEKESASCIAVHDKFVAIGTLNGYVYVLDHLGNFHPENTFRHHVGPVTKISIDESGGHFLSCGQDARISVYGIGSDDYTQIIELKQAVQSVAISPNFSRRNSHQMFVTANRNLTLYERRLLKTYKSQILFQGLVHDGCIMETSWYGSCIAFTNNTGTRIYDKKLDRIIALIQPVQRTETKCALQAKASHCWLDSSTIAIGLFKSISICSLRPDTELTNEQQKAEICHLWELSFDVADISYSLHENSFNWKELIVFGINEQPKSSKNDAGEVETEVQLISLEPRTYDTFAMTIDDHIQMRISLNCDVSQLHMSSLPTDSLYFLLSPLELIQIQPCSADDRVRWYLEHGLLREAMEYANDFKSKLSEINSFDIARQYMTSLIEKKRFSEAASNLKTVCGRQKDLWEYYFTNFENNNVLLQIARYLPVSDPQLEPECYQSVLITALYNHPVLFYTLVKSWSPDIYRAGAVVELAMKRIIRDDSNRELCGRDIVAIYRSLAKLHLYERNYEKALLLYTNLRDKTVFQVIEQYNLFDMVKNSLSKLMAVDENRTVRLLIENAGSFPASCVLNQITMHPKLQMTYLNRLFERNEGDEFADLAIRLYADYDNKRLSNFLRKSESYDIGRAMKICEEKKYINELIFLLGRSGDRLKALNLLVHKLDRMDSAIAFCRENNDADLWNALIDAAMSQPCHITQLLNTAGNYIDPLIVIQKIPPKLSIPGLRDSLVKILRDYESEVQMERECLNATMADSNDLFMQYIRSQSRSWEICDRSYCCVCKTNIVKSNPSWEAMDDVYIFACHHYFHKNCLDQVSSGFNNRSIDGGFCILCHNRRSTVKDSSR